jgi:hypothetical protein
MGNQVRDELPRIAGPLIIDNGYRVNRRLYFTALSSDCVVSICKILRTSGQWHEGVMSNAAARLQIHLIIRRRRVLPNHQHRQQSYGKQGDHKQRHDGPLRVQPARAHRTAPCSVRRPSKPGQNE